MKQNNRSDIGKKDHICRKQILSFIVTCFWHLMPFKLCKLSIIMAKVKKMVNLKINQDQITESFVLMPCLIQFKPEK